MKLPRKHGFTLVELLVVIGIIGLLIGILLPSLTRARAEAKRAVCLSNLRVLGQCYLEYVNENKGKGLFYFYSVKPPAGASFATSYWFAGNASYAGVYKWDVQQGYLAKFFKNPAFLTCPASLEFKSFSSTTSAFASSPLTTYAYNGNIMLSEMANISSSARIKNSSETCALIDGATIGTGDATGSVTGILSSITPWLRPPPINVMNNNYPTFHGRHAGRGSVLWYDGHATTETPYVTTLSSNIQPGIGMSTANGLAAVRRFKIGYLTPSTATEDQLFANFTPGNNTNNLGYYYWADKAARQ